MDLTFLSTTIYDNTIGAYLWAILIILVSFVVARTIYRIFKDLLRRVSKKTDSKVDDILVDSIEEPLTLLVCIAGVWVAAGTLVFPANIGALIQQLLMAAITVDVAWFITRFIADLVNAYVKPMAQKKDSLLDPQMVPYLNRAIAIVIWAIALVSIIDNFGYDVTAVVAGLGVGGLAIALAARPTLENIIGGLIIFTDRPFKLGDRVRIGSVNGHVVDVGLRTTRIRTFDNTIISIPNNDVVNAEIENIVLPDVRLRVKMVIGLTYDTSHEDLERAMELAKEIITKMEGVSERDEVLVHFESFGDFSLNIAIRYKVAAFNNKLSTVDRVNREIKKQFDKEGLEFAFPTQTVYVHKAHPKEEMQP